MDVLIVLSLETKKPTYVYLVAMFGASEIISFFWSSDYIWKLSLSSLSSRVLMPSSSFSSSSSSSLSLSLSTHAYLPKSPLLFFFFSFSPFFLGVYVSVCDVCLLV